MIYRLIDLPSNVIGFNASWQLTEKDFEEVLIPSVEQHVGRSGKLNCLIVLNNSLKQFRISALSGFIHLMHWKTNWRRVALVSGSKTRKVFFNLLSALFTGEFRVFSMDEMEQAIEWASQDKRK